MNVIRADEMGMCFGVKDALRAIEAVADPTGVTIHGELVHNPRVTHRLRAAGFREVPEDARATITATPLVLITAHGVSDRERRRLAAADKQLVDTTCPLVRLAHDAALELQAEGRHVVLIGKREHVEVRGIVEDLERYDVVSAAWEVRAYDHPRLGIVCQTTTPPDVVATVCAEVRRRNPGADVRFVDTVCHPTKQRQVALVDLLGGVDAVVVVGGRNSNNTLRLVELCRAHDVPALHVETAADVDPAWFSGVHTVGLTAGTSTLDETIDEVQRVLERIVPARQPLPPGDRHDYA